MDVTYDPCDTEVAPDGAATDDEIASLDAALELWNQGGSFRLIRSASHDEQRPPLVVHFRGSLGAFRGFYNDELGEIAINRRLKSDRRTITIAHELGHAFGLWHVDSSTQRSVMNPGNTAIEPTLQDIEDVRELWGSCD